MNAGIVYLGHDNALDYILKADGAVVDLSSATRMTLTLGSTLIDSDNGDADPIRWAKSGYATGQFRLVLGGLTITPGHYQNAWLVVYDPTNAAGVVFGSIPVFVMAEVEAS
jgi:hypothetical protein